MPEPLLELKNVSKIYGDPNSGVVALHDFSLTIDKDSPEIVTVAGESGSGKSTLCDLVLGFVRPTKGTIRFDGRDVGIASRADAGEHYREVQAVFQDPFSSFNPFYRVSHVFEAVLRNFRLATTDGEGRDMVEKGLNAVGLNGSDVLRKYPHQLSGGQRQRIMMARAYLVKPRLIVADEPVSMVDVSLRSSILDVMTKLRDEDGISFIYITHDLATAYQVGDRILMLYQGTLVEQGLASEVLSNPKHPYVRLLIDSVPRPDPGTRWEGEVELPDEGMQHLVRSTGCRFAPRCEHAMPECRSAFPPMLDVGPDGHRVSCILHKSGGDLTGRS